jgi:hypothetical protein
MLCCFEYSIQDVQKKKNTDRCMINDHFIAERLDRCYISIFNETRAVKCDFIEIDYCPKCIFPLLSF